MPESIPAAPSAADPGRNVRVTPYSGPGGPYTGSGGFLLLDKPVGVSSFQALRPVKRTFPKAKVGHAGTLDPAASGLLIAGVASGTRLLEYLEGMPKTYAFTALFGFVSDTCDLEGRVEAYAGTRLAAALTAEEVERAMAAFRGRIRQVPPAYSAIKIGGERAYALARAGEVVELEAREVEIFGLELKSFRPGSAESPETAPQADLVMTCSKGTYVRSLVVDLGRALDLGAVTGALRRLAIGPFRAEDAVTPESLTPASSLLPLETAVLALPHVIIPDPEVARFLNGQSVRAMIPAADPGRPSAGADLNPPIATSLPDSAEPAAREVRAHAADGTLLAIAALSPDGLCGPRKVLHKPLQEGGA
ncbi:MAG: tRNA pseudouridine(55) synthase TruB [Fibrobacteres bacterium]|jgi:tRNA pseudouridine55 synthase|nr:tRNA pseudouridine(55) synthase TruB [Fibrobacterota bacterium]